MAQPTLIISLDFELFWAFQDSRTMETYGPNILGGRKAIPQMLDLFEKHGIHATWSLGCSSRLPRKRGFTAMRC